MRDPLLDALLRERFAPSPSFKYSSTGVVDDRVTTERRLRDADAEVAEYDARQRKQRRKAS